MQVLYVAQYKFRFRLMGSSLAILLAHTKQHKKDKMKTTICKTISLFSTLMYTEHEIIAGLFYLILITIYKQILLKTVLNKNVLLYSEICIDNLNWH